MDQLCDNFSVNLHVLWFKKVFLFQRSWFWSSGGFRNGARGFCYVREESSFLPFAGGGCLEVLGSRRGRLSSKGKMEVTNFSSLTGHFLGEADNSLSMLCCVLRGVVDSLFHVFMNIAHIAVHDGKGVVDCPD